VRVPKHITLDAYIRQLIRDNNLTEFYKSEDWLELRADVLEELHNECQECLKLSPARVTRADCVHHVNHVRDRPALALSRYYTDKDGKEQRQLVPLCNACHNMQHPEKGGGKKDKFTNQERW
jgi:hypothetical protein